MGPKTISNVLRSSGYAAVGTIAYSASQFLILVAFARLGNAEMLGKYALALAITAPFFMFANMRLRFVVATDLKAETIFSNYFQYRVASALFATVLVAVGVAAASHAQDLFYIMLMMSLIRVVESLSDIVYGLYQRSHNLQLMAASMTFAGLAMLVATTISLSMGLTVVTILLTMLIARCLVFFSFDLIQWLRRWPPGATAVDGNRAVTGMFASILRRCWPLGLVALLVSLNTNIPRYYIEYLIDSEALGIFAALAYVPIAGYMIVGTMGQTMMPDIAKAFHASDRTAVIRGTIYLCGFGAGAGVLAITFGGIFGPHFLNIAYGREYAAYATLFNILLAAGAASYIVVGAVYVLTSAGYYKSQLVIYVIDFVLVSLLCAILLPILGINGSATAMLISQLIQVIVAILLVGSVIRKLGSLGERSTSTSVL